ncbi:MAG: nucleotide exchange factor GrpE [Candidatus Harrisonbacteria bacterium CG10_big_fil_rev_8_21_14_0_10_42_17]|uniref:Protein GrpE n=1 Tax=Candidatus Harrisonbacteria bacterium CG10_big_fil_rev_8_21_14_0_10_42_17 TaxID=1974584 RepID=A0A2M6WI16_9BACT|nr:MAG: nucleotide exchange factor GrpE [Candidatus Harrisonbacteria bacterium CG10_big_fil_rev_8_21_14_0_10_42_17]
MEEEQKEQKQEEQKKDSEEIEEVKTERDEYLNGWKRAKADLINYQREEAERTNSQIKFANKQFATDLLAVMDSFDLALTAEQEHNTEAQGLKLIRSQLESILERNGVTPIKTEGEQFNPKYHEAMREQDSDKPPGTIVEEVGRGWMLYEYVLRPTRVVVAKEQSESSGEKQ